ncbi:MAG: exopolyphosphatase [Hydrogenoanaerobacterium sp.]
MRLLTRSDFDGLACAVFLKEAGIIENYKFVHPKDLQDGLVEVNSDDCLANVPFVDGCGLWFDHHSSEAERNAYKGKYKGESRQSPSAAHIIYDYYGGAERFKGYEKLLLAVDKVDSANLTADEILHPTDWVLLGFIMDPRTGLGRFRSFAISNYQLMEKLIDWCRTMDIDEIMELPDIKERVILYNEQAELFTKMLKEHTKTIDEIIISDLRGVDTIYAGNRFMIYSLYPQQNISLWIVSGKGGIGCSVAVGHSVLNRTSKVDVGAVMLRFGGGGHHVVGTCQFDGDTMEEKIPQLIDEIVKLNK